MGETMLTMRIDESIKKKFLSKAQVEYGSGTRCLRKFIEAYTKDSFYINDDAVNLLLISVQGLHGYLNNMNQAVKKLHLSGELDPEFTPEFVKRVHLEIENVIRAFKSTVEIDTDRICSLLDMYRIDDGV
jgi:hypothetical protein